MAVMRLAITGLILVLAGCKMNMEAELFSSELRAAADGQQEHTAVTTLFLPVSSVDKCAEESAKIVAIMQGIVEPFRPRGCQILDQNSYMLADIRLPILASTDAWEETGALFGIISRYPEDGSNISVFLTMNMQAYQALEARVGAEFRQLLNLNESAFTLVLYNDERADMFAAVQHAFVDGQPILDSTYKTPRHHRVTIRLSDVSVDFLGKNGVVPAFTLLIGMQS